MNGDDLPNGNDRLPDPIETSVESHWNIPEPLREYNQWICWGTEERTNGDDETYETKVPLDVTKPGAHAACDDPETWVSFERACEYDRHHETTDGIGFVFTDDDPFTGIDFDNVVDDDSLDWEEWARAHIECVDSYTERSPTKTGAHTIARGTKPGDRCRTGMEQTLEKFEKSEIEIYETDRFFTVTGDHVGWTPKTINEAQAAIESVYASSFDDDDDESESADLEEFEGDALDALEANKSQPSTPERDEEADLSDEEIIEKWDDAKNGRDISGLYNGSTAGYESHSEARMALLHHLAFWTGEDPLQMDRMYRDSDLHPHPNDDGKWDRVGVDEIKKAIKKNSETYTPPREKGDDDSLRAQRNDLLEKIEAKASLSKAKRTVAEERLIEDWIDANIDELTAAESGGDLKGHCSLIADVSMHFNQTEIIERVEEAIGEEHDVDDVEDRIDNAAGPAVADPFDVIIADRLNRVEITRTTDHVQRTEYQWEFEDGTFTTSCEDTRVHFNWHHFRNEYYDVTGNNALKPTPQRREPDDWRKFIIAIIEDRKVEREEVGPRTSAVLDLQSYVNKSKAFGTLEAAASRRGVYLNGDPDADSIAEQPTQLWIPNAVTERITENYGLATSRNIQSELSARGHTAKVRGRSGTSVKETVNGRNIVFWVIDPEYAEPLSYTEDPMDSDTTDTDQNDRMASDTANTGVLAEVLAGDGNE